MKRLFKSIMLLMIIICLIACGSKEKNETVKEGKYEVKIDVDCIKNILFSKYDISIFVDGKKIGDLEHGKKDIYKIKLESGKHTFKVEKKEDSSVDGKIKFSISENSNLKYTISCSRNQVEINEVAQLNPPIASDELGEKKYKDIVKLFEDLGFTNVQKKAIKDLNADELDRKSIVETIEVNGNSNFSKDDKLFSDTEILVKYHTSKEIKPPEDACDFQGKDYNDVVEKFKKAGFINVTTEEDVVTNIFSDNNHKVEDVNIDGESIQKDDYIPIDKKIVVKYYVIEESKSGTKSSTTLSEFYAKKAFEKYGKKLYPYGFKCHWFMDLIYEGQQQDGSWFFKVGVTITNAFGAEYDTIAEGIVGGSDLNPEVIQFYVSN